MGKCTSWKARYLQYIHKLTKRKEWILSFVIDKTFEGANLHQTIFVDLTQLQPMKFFSNMHVTTQNACKVKGRFTMNFSTAREPYDASVRFI